MNVKSFVEIRETAMGKEGDKKELSRFIVTVKRNRRENMKRN